jgi:hypothetical protein
MISDRKKAIYRAFFGLLKYFNDNIHLQRRNTLGHSFQFQDQNVLLNVESAAILIPLTTRLWRLCRQIERGARNTYASPNRWQRDRFGSALRYGMSEVFRWF